MDMSFSAFTFDDVMFQPQYSEIQSRSEVCLSSKIGNLDLDLPVISANMRDVTEGSMAREMFINGGLGILHRFMPIEDNVEMFLESVSKANCHPKNIGVSVGVGDESKNRFDALYSSGARTFCIDVAHGHHVNVKDMLIWISNNYNREDMTIIAGNIATWQAADALKDWGAGVVKVGIGPGSCCKTRENTGVGIPQLYALKEIRTMCGDIQMIADGGIKKTGDIAKALLYADAVMMGGFLSGTTETPGHVYEKMDGQLYKTIAGSASAESKVKSGKSNSFVEGGIREVPFRGRVKYILKKIRENVQSSFSYSGARNIKEFRERAKLVPISGGGKKESKF